MTYALGFLMVSSIPYYSFKELDGFQRMSFRTLFLMILLLSVIVAQPTVMLFTLGLVYASSGPLGYVHRFYQSRRQPVLENTEEQEVLSGKQ
jgi:CDP-diacylglycerol--serine O-phosphatidyltransferase